MPLVKVTDDADAEIYTANGRLRQIKSLQDHLPYEESEFQSRPWIFVE